MPTTKKTSTRSKTVTKTSSNDKETPQAKPVQSRKNIQKVLIVALIVLALYYARGLFVVALVNGQPVTRLEVIRELEKQAGQGTTDALISEKLIISEAKNRDITVAQADVDARIAEIEDELTTSGQNLDELLELQGITRAEVEEQTRLQLLLRALLADTIAVSDEEIESVFEQQLEIKPEDMSDEEFRAQIASSLEEQKFSFEAQTFVQKLQNEANIQYWFEY